MLPRDFSHPHLIQLHTVPVTTTNHDDKAYSTVTSHTHPLAHTEENLDVSRASLVPPLVNVKQENELIALDQHYRRLLKTEREEHRRQLQRIQREAERKARAEAERRMASKGREELAKAQAANERLAKENERVRRKLKQREGKLTRQEGEIEGLKRKLEDLWERRQVEKENAKLLTKYDLDKES